MTPGRSSARERWLFAGLVFAGGALIALAIWLDVRDGVPTMRKGDHPWEVVIVGGLGIALLGSGLNAMWRARRSRRSAPRKPENRH